MEDLKQIRAKQARHRAELKENRDRLVARKSTIEPVPWPQPRPSPVRTVESALSR